jgi:hypothetical protein
MQQSNQQNNGQLASKFLISPFERVIKIMLEYQIL